MRAIFQSYTVAELRKLARTHNKEMKIAGVGNLKKRDLIDKLMRFQHKFQELPISNKGKERDLKKHQEKLKLLNDPKYIARKKKEKKEEEKEMKRRAKERQKEWKEMEKEEMKMLKFYPFWSKDDQVEFGEDYRKFLEQQKAQAKRKAKAKVKNI